VAQVAVYTTHKYSVGRAYNCWMLNLLMHRVTRRLIPWVRTTEYVNHMSARKVSSLLFSLLPTIQELHLHSAQHVSAYWFTRQVRKTCLKRNLTGPENFSAKASFRLIEVHCLKRNLKGSEHFPAKARLNWTEKKNKVLTFFYFFQ
jgi:hypothetical protein